MKELDAAVKAWIEDGWLCGAAAGIITPDGIQTAGWGNAGLSAPPVDAAHTIFSVGSITKIFAATALAGLVGEGLCSLETPVEEVLPAGGVMPQPVGRKITLLDLVTHSSGLPAKAPYMGTPDGLSGGPRELADRLFAFLSGYALSRAPGTGYEYSNVGFGLLGLVLGRLTRLNFESIIHTRIAGPLGMASTQVTTPAELRPRVAVGVTADGMPFPFRDHGYAGASGSLRSTVPDLLKFLALHLGLGDAPASLAAAARLTHAPRFETGPGVSRGLGWVVEHEPGIIWHTGAIAACRAFMGFVPGSRTGLVLLTNSSNPAADTLGLQALRAAAGLPFEIPRPPALVALTPGELDRLCGGYRLGTGELVRIARAGQKLVAQGGSLGRVVFYPTSPLDFYVPGIEGEAVFRPGLRGTPWTVRVRAWGSELVLQRIGPLAWAFVRAWRALFRR